MNVGPCIMHFAEDSDIRSATLWVVATAANVMNPPVSAFPMSIMSGSTPALFPGKEASGASESCGNLIEYQ